jgi:hypothetical protein
MPALRQIIGLFKIMSHFSPFVAIVSAEKGEKCWFLKKFIVTLHHQK